MLIFLTNAHNFQTHTGNFNQSRNLLCHLVENKYNIFVQSKYGNMLEISAHTPEIYTNQTVNFWTHIANFD